MPQPGIEPWREESEPKPDDGTYVKSVSHAQIRGVYKEMGVTLAPLAGCAGIAERGLRK